MILDVNGMGMGLPAPTLEVLLTKLNYHETHETFSQIGVIGLLLVPLQLPSQQLIWQTPILSRLFNAHAVINSYESLVREK